MPRSKRSPIEGLNIWSQRRPSISSFMVKRDGYMFGQVTISSDDSACQPTPSMWAKHSWGTIVNGFMAEIYGVFGKL